MQQMTYIQLFHLIGAILIGTVVTECVLRCLIQLLSWRKDELHASASAAQRRSIIPRLITGVCSWTGTSAAAFGTHAALSPSRAYLEELPPRAASRTIPSIGDAVRRSLQHHIVALTEENPNMLYLGRSSFESTAGGVSLYAKRTGFDGKTVWRGMVLETSNANRRVWVRLNPIDAELVRARGWEQEQRSRGICASWALRKPEEVWVGIWMPTDHEEMETVEQIVRAGVWSASMNAGELLEEGLEGNTKLQGWDRCHS